MLHEHRSGNPYGDIFKKTTQLTLNSMRASFEQKLQIPRTTLAIMNAVQLAFPDEMHVSSENIHLLDAFSPVMIAGNEATDIGVSACLKRKVRQTHFYELFKLELETQEKLRGIQTQFITRYPQHKDIVEVFVHDLEKLSFQRDVFAHNMDVFLELDSAIFEKACVALLVPSVLDRLKTTYTIPADTPEELVSNYGLFLNSDGERADTLTRLQSLHAVEMVLKIDDDTRGVEVDRLLGLPNFVSWASIVSQETGQTPKQILRQKRNRYTDIAVAGKYLPRKVVDGIGMLSGATSVLKANKSRVPAGTSLTQIPYIRSFTTTFRHELMESGHLDIFY